MKQTNNCLILASMGLQLSSSSGYKVNGEYIVVLLGYYNILQLLGHNYLTL